MSDAPAKPKPRRWRRLLRRLAVLFFLMGVAFSMAVWWAYENRLSLANRALESLDPLGVTVSYLDVDHIGNIDLREITVRDKASGATLLQLPSLKAQIEWGKAFSGHLKSLTLEQPDIQVDQAFLQKLLNPPAGASSQSAPPAAAAASPWQIGRLDVQKARIRLKQANGTVIDLTASYQGEGLSLSPEGEMNSGEQELTLEGGSLRAATGGEPPLSLRRAHLQGRISNGVLDLDHLALQDLAVSVTPEVMIMLGMQKREGALPSPATPPPSMIKGVHINEVAITGLSVKAAGFQPNNASGYVLPDTAFRLDHTAKGLRWDAANGPAFEAFDLSLKDYSMTVPDQPGHVRMPDVLLKLGAHEGAKPWLVEEFKLAKPEVLWTPALSAFFPASNPTNPAPATATVSAAGGQTAIIKKADIVEASIAITDPALLLFDLRTKGNLSLSNLEVNDKGLHSTEAQSLELADLVLQFATDERAPAWKPFFQLEQGELIVKPDEWVKTKRVEKLALTKPVVLMRDGNTPWLDITPSDFVGPPAPIVTVPATPTEANPWWKALSFAALELADGQVEVLANAPKPVDAKARLNITTEVDAAGQPVHRIRFEDFSAKLPTLSRLPFPVATAGMMEGVVRLPEMWQQHRVEELRLEGASIEAGESLMGLFEPVKTVTPGPAAASAPLVVTKDSPWHVGHLEVSQSTITIANMVPGLPTLKFGVAFAVEDSPLFADDLARNIVPQRVELANIIIPSPYEPLRPVSELDSVFIHFTLDGIMRKEIEKVEIVSPTLYVGEDLFWYVDYYRKYAAENSTAGPNSPAVATVGADQVAEKLAAEVITAEPAASDAAWSVKRLQVHSGKLVLAPKGKRLKGFREPFPFNIDTELVQGRMEATLDIPKDTYTLEQYKLEFVGTRGHVSFNLPLKQKDNNMVETFEVDSIRWKDMRTGKAFLSVTYDALGIYSKFGAEAYDGYVNGEVNIYLDDNYHWDGWLGAKNVKTHDITKALTPGAFMMDGVVEATLVAQGSKDELYQADGSFKNHTPGTFSISALNDLVKDLPGDWTALEKQITQMGVETFRDFAYDTADAKCRLYGREGNGHLHFIGPKGSRKFDINVYDHRWKVDAPLATQE